MRESAIFLLVLMGGLGGLSRSTAASELSRDAKRGKVVYHRYCISCHGEFGNGGGDRAAYLTPRPRDFRQGTYKWRSTPTGTLPQISDLERTITNGVYGTAMPSWYTIPHRERLEVIAYCASFSDAWKKEKPGKPIVIPPEPPYTEASVEQGKATYKKLGCAKCHGDQGLGDGSSAPDLKDDWGYAIAPYNFTVGHPKGGKAATDIYRTLMTGLNGTPMPSFAEMLTPQQAWDLAHYIQSWNPPHARKNLAQTPAPSRQSAP